MDLNKKLEELRLYYSDEQIAEDFEKYADDYAKDGYNKQDLLKFASGIKKDPGVMGSVVAGAKRELDKVVSGGAQTYLEGRQLFGRMTGNQEPVDSSRSALESLQSEEKAKNAELERIRSKHPFAVTAGEILPAMLPSYRASVAGRLASPALSYGALGGMQYGSPEDRVKQGASNLLSNVGGGMLSEAGQFAVKPGVPLSKAQTQAMDGMQAEARGAGAQFRPSAGDLTGSKAIQGLEDTLSQTPVVDQFMAKQQAQRQQAMNRVAAKSIGQDADELTPDVIGAANRKVDSAYQQLRAVKGKTFQMDQTLSKAADDLLKSEGMRSQANPALVRFATDAKRLVSLKSKLTGEAVDLLRQDLADFARNATGGEAHRAGELLKAFDESVRNAARTAGIPEVAENLDEARRIYRNIKVLDRPNVTKGGNVMPNSLRPVVEREGTAGSELQAISDYAGAFPQAGQNSRTYGRGMWAYMANQPLAGVPLVMAGAAAGKALDNDVVRSYMRRGLLMDPDLSYGGALALDPLMRGYGTEGTRNALIGPVFGK